LEDIKNPNPSPDTRWKPGQSGNPNGRPKFSILSIIKEKLKDIPDGRKKISRCEALVEIYLRDIEKRRDGVAIRDLLDRVDGRAMQRIQVGNEKDEEWLKLFREIRNGAVGKTESDTESGHPSESEDSDS